MATDICTATSLGGNHRWYPWVQERWRPSVDTRVCMLCGVAYEVRAHVDGTEMFPAWLADLRRQMYIKNDR